MTGETLAKLESTEPNVFADTSKEASSVCKAKPLPGGIGLFLMKTLRFVCTASLFKLLLAEICGQFLLAGVL